jgi:hypothetical protein
MHRTPACRTRRHQPAAHATSGYLRYRCPIDKFESMLAAVTGLFFFAEYSN